MPRNRDNRVKTANALDFSDDDYALISEGLRIARTDLLASSASLEKLWPTSPLVERLNVYAERMADMRERIDAL